MYVNDSWTVPKIKEFCKTNDIKVPSGLKKDALIGYVNGTLNERNNKIVSVNVTSNAKLTEIVPVYMNSTSPLLHLYMYGWCVYPIDCWREEFVSMFFDWLELMSPNFKRDDRSTWKSKNMIMNLHGIFKQYIGHIELLWLVRELIAYIFAMIYECDPNDLLCSFDGGCFMAPKKSKNQSWFHNDTPRGGDLCYQGLVNFVDNGPEDGGLVLVEGSHECFEEYMINNPSYGFKWGPCNMDDNTLKNRRIIKICAPKGSLILWNGKTFHCNVNCSPLSNSFRMCTYVSMQPRSKCTPKELEKRIKLYEQGRMTGHWTYGKYFEATPKNPRNYGGTQIIIDNPEVAGTNVIREGYDEELNTRLNILRRRLIGYEK